MAAQAAYRASQFCIQTSVERIGCRAGAKLMFVITPVHGWLVTRVQAPTLQIS